MSFRFQHKPSTDLGFVSFQCQPQVPNLVKVNVGLSSPVRLKTDCLAYLHENQLIVKINLSSWLPLPTYDAQRLNFMGDYPANTRDVVPRLPAHKANCLKPNFKNRKIASSKIDQTSYVGTNFTTPKCDTRSLRLDHAPFFVTLPSEGNP